MAIITDTLRIVSTAVPATPTSSGQKGDIAWDANYYYICIEDNLWSRMAHYTEWSNS